VPAEIVQVKATRARQPPSAVPLVLALFTGFVDELGWGLIIPVAPLYADQFRRRAEPSA
jgi:hypothetical protein